MCVVDLKSEDVKDDMEQANICIYILHMASCLNINGPSEIKI